MILAHPEGSGASSPSPGLVQGCPGPWKWPGLAPRTPELLGDDRGGPVLRVKSPDGSSPPSLRQQSQLPRSAWGSLDEHRVQTAQGSWQDAKCGINPN